MREENLILNWSYLLIMVVVVGLGVAVAFVVVGGVALVDAAAVGIVFFVLQVLQSAA
jgi:hypothetical protein